MVSTSSRALFFFFFLFFLFSMAGLFLRFLLDSSTPESVAEPSSGSSPSLSPDSSLLTSSKLESVCQSQMNQRQWELEVSIFTDRRDRLILTLLQLFCLSLFLLPRVQSSSFACSRWSWKQHWEHFLYYLMPVGEYLLVYACIITYNLLSGLFFFCALALELETISETFDLSVSV